MVNARNLLLISLDCARADVAYSGILPNLAAVQRCGVTYALAIASAPLTPISHATVLTGLQPYSHGLREMLRSPLPRKHPTLAQLLRSEGYRTAAFLAAPALDRWFGLSKGFEKYDDAMDQYRGISMRRAYAIADAGIRWLGSLSVDEHWFCFLHFFDAHWPYLADEEQGDAANAYEAGLRAADQQFGRVLEWLRDHGKYDETLVVVFGDHGEDLAGYYANDRGSSTLGHPEEHGHGCLLYQTTQHVPLVFAHSDIRPNTCSDLVGLVDVLPTICALLDVRPPRLCEGTDLAQFYGGPVESRRQLYAETLYPSKLAALNPELRHLRNLQAQWLDARTKIIRNSDDPSSALIFDLFDDPLEQHPHPGATLAASLHWPHVV